MSGATLAAGRRPDTGKADRMYNGRASDAGMLGGVMGSLRVVDLQLLAFIVVFSASGMVPIGLLVFPIFISIYIFLLSSLVFPQYGSSKANEVFKGNRWFQGYVIVGTAVGLFLPLGYVLGGFARGDQQSVRAAVPHLFLLSFQILSENLIIGLQIFSLPVRVLLPIFYSVRRLFLLADWTQEVFSRSVSYPNASLQNTAWLSFGRSLAIANTVYFSVNLFGFLIPMFLPRAFERYWEDKAQYIADKKSAKPLPTPAPPHSEQRKER